MNNKGVESSKYYKEKMRDITVTGTIEERCKEVWIRKDIL